MRRKDDEKQKAIKKAVVQTVLREGMHGTSISKIAKAAGVSPATVYIYYDNKDRMLEAIYHEYAEAMFESLTQQLTDALSAAEFIERVVKAYYLYIRQHGEAHHFVEQFSACPSLSKGCAALKGPEKLDARIKVYKTKGMLMDYDSNNIWAMLFYPVKGIMKKSCGDEANSEASLNEMIQMIQRALLK